VLVNVSLRRVLNFSDQPLSSVVEVTGMLFSLLIYIHGLVLVSVCTLVGNFNYITVRLHLAATTLGSKRPLIGESNIRGV
jgi:hypothetical protein